MIQILWGLLNLHLGLGGNGCLLSLKVKPSIHHK